MSGAATLLGLALAFAYGAGVTQDGGRRKVLVFFLLAASVSLGTVALYLAVWYAGSDASSS